MERKTRMAIIGSAGYIGSYLFEGFRNHAGYEVVGYDILESATTTEVKRGRDVDVKGFDVVIFLGGLSGRASCARETWGNIYHENVEEVLEVARKMGRGQLLVYASTAGLLEGAVDAGATEDWKVREELLDSYTLSMHEREKAIQAVFEKTRGLEVGPDTVGLRFGTVIGIAPTQRRDLVHIAMMRSAFMEGVIDVQRPGCKRSILWIKDLFRAVMAVVYDWKVGEGHRVYNVGSFNTTIGEIALKISEHTGIESRVVEEGGEGTGFWMDPSAFVLRYRGAGGGVIEGNNDKIIKNLKEHIGQVCFCDDSVEKRCRVCKEEGLGIVLDLGFQPLANNFTAAPCVQNTYPLCLVRCKECNHTQLNYTVRPEVMFRNYQYNSGTSWTLREYFAGLAAECTKELGGPGSVLELACNDGSQLDEFQKLGWKTYGVDPATNLVGEARKRGHHVECGFWGKERFDGLPPAEEIDIIVAQNVVAHVPDPVAFLKACAEYMNAGTVLYVQTSQCNMYRNGEFDTIYHEHLSFFTVCSMMRAAEEAGLGVTRVVKKPIHGTSYLFTMRKGEHGAQAIEELDKEREFGLYDDLFYEGYRRKIEGIKDWVAERIAWCRERRIRVVAYGAAAKGMTMLNYFDIKDICYIIDDAPMKRYKFTPGTNVMVRPLEDIEEERDDSLCVLVLAWNFIEEIEKRLRWHRGPDMGVDTHIIKVFPEQEFYSL